MTQLELIGAVDLSLPTFFSLYVSCCLFRLVCAYVIYYFFFQNIQNNDNFRLYKVYHVRSLNWHFTPTHNTMKNELTIIISKKGPVINPNHKAGLVNYSHDVTAQSVKQ